MNEVLASAPFNTSFTLRGHDFSRGGVQVRLRMADLTRMGSDWAEYSLFPARLTDFTLNTYSFPVSSPWTVNLKRGQIKSQMWAQQDFWKQTQHVEAYLCLLFVFGCSPAPGVGDGLVVDGVPVFFAVLAVVDVVALDVVFVAGLLPLEQHRGVRVSDGQGRVRRSRSSWWESWWKKRHQAELGSRKRDNLSNFGNL